MRDCPLLQALRYLVRPAKLDLRVVGDTLLLTHVDGPAGDLETRLYDVEAILPAWDDGPPRSWQSYRSLEELITQTIAPEMWDPSGGEGTSFVVGHILVASQSVEVQERLQVLLDRLTELADQPADVATIDVASRFDSSVAFQNPKGDGILPPMRTSIYPLNVTTRPAAVDASSEMSFWDLDALAVLLAEQLPSPTWDVQRGAGCAVGYLVASRTGGGRASDR